MNKKAKHKAYGRVTLSLIMAITVFSTLLSPINSYAAPAIPSALKVTHTAETPYSWYFNPNNAGSVPLLDAGMKFIKNHGAYYVNDNIADADKVIYLTFDCGYVNENVCKIVDTLNAHDADGAFFVLEHTLKSSPELMKSMKESGHLICNHTCRHHDMSKYCEEEFTNELAELEKVANECAAVTLDRFYRPPEGRFCENNLSWADSAGYKTVFWSFAYADWDNDAQPDPEKSMKKILDHTHNGMIILLHPTSKTNADILDRLLCEWEKQGYRFGSLYELN